MGFDLDRIVGSSRKKTSEPHCLNSSGKQRGFSNVAANVSEVQYELNPIKGKSEEKMPISALKKVETGKCEKGGKGVMVVKWEEDLEKSDWTQNLKLRVNSANVENGKMGLKNNGMTSPTPSSSLMDSRKHVKHLRSASFREEGRNSVIRKQEMGSNVRTPRTPGNSTTSMRDDEKVNDSHIGDPAIGDPKSRNVCSFGNVYRGHKKLVVNADPPHQKLPQVPRVNGNVVNCPSSSNILGFGGGNYGHGSIIKGGKNVEVLKEQQNSMTSSSVSYFESVEELKNAGNEEYKGGHFLEAISFYNKAITLCPQNAPCHNNKAAALACLGRYAEAVEECFKAIDCDPLYSRAHHRLGNLYLRFGQVEDAKQHLKLSGQEIGSEILQNLHRIETHLTNIRSAQKVEDWRRILTESNLAIEAGADASYEVLAAKAEALLKLNKPKKSLEVLTAAKKLSGNKSRKVHNRDWDFLIIETQVYIYLGRFDDGILAAEHAVNLDARTESLIWLRKARAVSDARRAGNEYFKAEKFLEACMAYSRGLEYFPTNSILLSNRAACRIKLGKWEMAVDDCNVALRSQFNNTKALLRRAQSNARLERWEESLRDYTVLSKEMPEDIAIANSLAQVHLMFKNYQGA